MDIAITRFSSVLDWIFQRVFRNIYPLYQRARFWMFRPSIRVKELWIYPVKSCQGISLTKKSLNECGFKWDRHWVIVDSNGTFMTQRKYPKMALIKPRFESSFENLEFLVLSSSLMNEDVRIKLRNQGDFNDDDQGELKEVKIWSDTCWGYDEGDVVSRWLSKCLEVEGARLLVKSDVNHRQLDTKFTQDLETDYSPLQVSYP